jgi:hypothetical protein
MLVKPPVEQQCMSYGLRGCPELVDAAILYIEGDQAGAAGKVRKAKAANKSEDIRKFAEALKQVANTPGLGDYAQPLGELATLLADESAANNDLAAPAESKAAAGPDDRRPGAIAGVATGANPYLSEAAAPEKPAASKPVKRSTESFTAGESVEGQTCNVAGKRAICFSRSRGPFVVTDAVALPECPHRTLIGAGKGGPTVGAIEMAWVVEATHPGVTGGSFWVAPDRPVYVVVILSDSRHADPDDPRCVVTWAAYRRPEWPRWRVGSADPDDWGF